MSCVGGTYVFDRDFGDNFTLLLGLVIAAGYTIFSILQKKLWRALLLGPVFALIANGLVFITATGLRDYVFKPAVAPSYDFVVNFLYLVEWVGLPILIAGIALLARAIAWLSTTINFYNDTPEKD